MPARSRPALRTALIAALLAAAAQAHAQPMQSACCIAVAPANPAAPTLRFDAIGPYDGITPRNRLPMLPAQPGLPPGAAALAGGSVPSPGVAMTFSTPVAGGSASFSLGIRTPEPAPGNRLSLIAPP